MIYLLLRLSVLGAVFMFLVITLSNVATHGVLTATSLVMETDIDSAPVLEAKQRLNAFLLYPMLGIFLLLAVREFLTFRVRRVGKPAGKRTYEP